MFLIISLNELLEFTLKTLVLSTQPSSMLPVVLFVFLGECFHILLLPCKLASYRILKTPKDLDFINIFKVFKGESI